MGESPTPMGGIERSAHDGLPTIVTDNAQDSQFEVAVDGQVIGRQPYRRYRGHIVLMATEVDARRRIRPRVPGERRTIRTGRALRRAVDNQFSCRVPTCLVRRRGVVPRSTRCATRRGLEPAGRTGTIHGAVIVQAIDAEGGALLTRVNGLPG
jgi:hypothetical protein